jgi:hypothetical protein
MNKIHAKRRFSTVNISDPGDVKALDGDHPAMMAGTTMFANTVVNVDKGEKLLISARENRKIGHMVTKGAWRGFPIFTLTLTERATCPAHCHMLDTCYGNAMPFARRNTGGKLFEQKLEVELAALAKEHFRGFVVRLHVLGDFYSEDYVEFWRAMLAKHKQLHVYGYTAHRMDAPEPKDRVIAEAIDNVRRGFGPRFAMRWSRAETGPGHAVVIDYIPATQRVAEGFVCPAEMEKSACCATCGLCWSPELAGESIVFIKHGMGASKTAAIARRATTTEPDGWRRVQPIENFQGVAIGEIGDKPELMWVAPTDLYVDETYQRNLSAKSMRLIGKISSAFRWAHFGVPIVGRCSETSRLFLIDGQHTAIGAATRGVPLIPVLIVTVERMQDRARAFVSRNRDRIAVTQLQQHHSDIVAEDPETVQVEAVCREAGIKILRHPAPRAVFLPGETIALATIKWLLRRYGQEGAITALRAVAKCAPVSADAIKAAAKLTLDPAYRGFVPLDALMEVLGKIPEASLIAEARQYAAHSGMPNWEARAAVLYRHVRGLK